jgi:hypothetical protein
MRKSESRFRVGQLVRLSEAPGAPDLYQVVHILEEHPSGDIQYRLRGIHVPNERHVCADRISPATIDHAARGEPPCPSGYLKDIPLSASVPPTSSGLNG